MLQHPLHSGTSLNLSNRQQTEPRAETRRSPKPWSHAAKCPSGKAIQTPNTVDCFSARPAIYFRSQLSLAKPSTRAARLRAYCGLAIGIFAKANSQESSVTLPCRVEKASKSNPDIKQLFYIRGILRNRIPGYFDEARALQYLKNARSWDIDLNELSEIARRVKNWSQFTQAIGDAIGRQMKLYGESGDQ
jgi:hypothetical protein